jgi:signal transduction histidine kinase
MRTVLLVLVDALPLRRSLIRVTDMLMQTLGLFMTTAHTSAVELHVHRDDDIPAAMYGDNEKLAWVFATLVGNALRMIQQNDRRGEGGRIDLEAHFDHEQKSFVFIVSDTGPGIPASISQWLFQRNPSTGKAAGLALLMVQDVIAAHKGTIDVASTIGKGTRFTIRIPKLQAPA